MIFPLFSLKVNAVESQEGLHSLAIQPEKALGQTWIMSSSPPVSQQVMLIRKDDSELPCAPQCGIVPTRLAGREVSAYFPRAHPRAQGKLRQSQGFRDKGDGKNIKYSKQFIIPCLFILLWYRGIHDVGECFSKHGPQAIASCVHLNSDGWALPQTYWIEIIGE